MHVKALVCFCDSIGAPGRGTLYIILWQFMLKVQSEGVGLEWGSPDDIVPCLFTTRSQDRLARRKHRSQGSFLQRPRTCSSLGATFCVVHRLLQLSAVQGKKISDRTAYEVQRDFRDDCESCHIPEAKKRTLKSFRSGKATDMAARGDTLASILECGEWRSCALLK